MNKRFFSFDPDCDGMIFHETDAQAKNIAQDDLDYERSERDFQGSSGDICWGALFEEDVNGKLTKTPKAEEFDSLLEACQMAYRKHHLDDDDIGWDDLSTKLLDTLCNIMGEEKFINWVTSLKKGKFDNNHIFEAIEMPKKNGKVKLSTEMMNDKFEKLQDKLQRIEERAKAYPLDIFPEPDFKKAAKVLKENGMNLSDFGIKLISNISASTTRRILDGVKKIIEED